MVPQHIAVIPDGNRRWAESRQFKPWDGHTEGVKRFWDIADAAYKTGVTHITFWAASYDNLQKRTKLEVEFLLHLMETELSKPEVLERCLKNETKFQIFGEWRSVITNTKLVTAIENLQNKTQHFNDNVLTILFVYDGQREMLQAIKALAKTEGEITSEILQSQLWTGSLPPVDYVIRTGGEPHWSAGFMMWHTANSQFYFTHLLWPDFNEQQFDRAMQEYEKRERRLGK